jgi:hypothetical protein
MSTSRRALGSAEFTLSNSLVPVLAVTKADDVTVGPVIESCIAQRPLGLALTATSNWLPYDTRPLFKSAKPIES